MCKTTDVVKQMCKITNTVKEMYKIITVVKNNEYFESDVANLKKIIFVKQVCKLTNIVKFTNVDKNKCVY